MLGFARSLASRSLAFAAIALSIGLVLVGTLAPPFFQDNLCQGQNTKARQDLDCLRNALALHDGQNAPLNGSDLRPLLGRYLQELPRDPWGRPYRLDPVNGKLFSLGPDGRGGDGPGNSKLVVELLPPVLPGSEAMASSWFRDGEGAFRRPPPAPRDPRSLLPPENPFVDCAADPLSTFAADVDTASYNLARSCLRAGRLPDPRCIRSEGIINAIPYEDEAPKELPFMIHLEGAPSLYDPNLDFLRVAIRSRAPSKKRPPARLTFLVDSSGSMSGPARMTLVKDALGWLLERLGPEDRVALVAYDQSARLLRELSGPEDREGMLRAIYSLTPGGGTDIETGLRLAYATARRNHRSDGINRIILCTDGVATVGKTRPDELVRQLRGLDREDIDLTVLGFGMGSYSDATLEGLARAGNGSYAYVDDRDEARRLFGEGLDAGLRTVARDAKIQLRFDGKAVATYRLLGYENRAVADRHFRNDRADGGEIGAGHAVTALYEIRRIPATKGALATVALRAREGKGTDVIELQRKVTGEAFRSRFDEASPSFRLSVVAAAWAERLRKGSRADRLPWKRLLQEGKRAIETLARPGERHAELLRLMGRSEVLLRRQTDRELTASE